MARKPVKRKEPDFEFYTEYGIYTDFADQRRIDGILFEEDEIRNHENDRSFHECRFSSVTFHGEFEESEFADIVFDHCDLSNCSFNASAFRRVWFRNCRIVGTVFSECSFQDVKVTDCQGDYSNFAASKWKNGKWMKSRFREASFSMMELKNVEAHECDFTKTEFLHTRLAGMDFSDCVIEGAGLSAEDIRGLTVSTLQAIDCAVLLGLIVKD